MGGWGGDLRGRWGATPLALSRRRFLVGGAGAAVALGAGGVVLVERGVLPGRSRLDQWRGGCDVEAPVPDVAPGRVVDGSFRSVARATDVGWTLLLPPGAREGDRLPLCVGLHGRGATHDLVRTLGVDRFLAAAVQGGSPPFAVVGVDGGDAVNWHRRATGDAPVRMVSDELLPAMAERGLAIDRVGLWGWSLGGWGALHLAATWGSGRVAAVVSTSPAIWRSVGDAQPRTFDGEADFVANDLFSRTDRLRGIPIRIDCGESDPFADAAVALAERLEPQPVGGLAKGCHDDPFFRSVAPTQIAFLASALNP